MRGYVLLWPRQWFDLPLAALGANQHQTRKGCAAAPADPLALTESTCDIVERAHGICIDAVHGYDADTRLGKIGNRATRRSDHDDLGFASRRDLARDLDLGLRRVAREKWHGGLSSA